jgi:hydrogenase-4 membrane subunit HyfE
MTSRDRIRIVQIGFVSTFVVWGLLAGMSAGSQYQEDTGSPFSDVTVVALSLLIVLSALLGLVPVTRRLAKSVAVSAVAFVLAVLLGHLLGNHGLGGPEVPTRVPGQKQH